MNLNEQEKEMLLQSFYAEKLVPLAEKYESAERAFFPVGFDKQAESYYIDRNDDRGYIHEINYDDLESELLELWNGETEEFKKLAAPLIELAHKLEDHEEADGDVSPFIYAMF